MGYFDGMKVMLGRGMDVADRKSQELRLQAELSKIDVSLGSAYAALGRVAYSNPTITTLMQRECPDAYGAVAALLQEEQDVRGRIEELQRQAVSTGAPSLSRTRHFRCAKCGAHVTLDLAYCPSCGDNLSELKGQYRTCPNCGTYHAADSVFCMQCGAKTVEVPVAPIQSLNVVGAVTDNGALNADPHVRNASQITVGPTASDDAEVLVTPAKDVASAPASPTCPKCGAAVASDDMFCGECGMRLNG